MQTFRATIQSSLTPSNGYNIGSTVLTPCFPLLFALAVFKNAKVCDVWFTAGDSGILKFPLRRILRDWEEPVLADLLEKLTALKCEDDTDSWVWKWSKLGHFTVKSMYRQLLDEMHLAAGTIVVFPSDLLEF
ncbi:hypothetical protein FRX31_021498 [Thalictrum thalictroides]|uniref:Uncharacterized protein n=1 Tax=Thalictrum thalictroides TaxID=46969 RepID=A0A7J6VUY4_THATH|nr:hypothetical protein FRX31_021498 [Thalictrum thalictroides]